MESSEIDLSEFQNENPEDGVGDTENGTGQGENQPSEAPAESVSGNAGMQYSIGCSLGSYFHNAETYCILIWLPMCRKWCWNYKQARKETNHY